MHTKTKFFISKSNMDATHSANVYNVWAMFETKLHVLNAGVSEIIRHKDQQRTKLWLYKRYDGSGDRGRQWAGERIITN
jgi:hypothetical protein